MRRSIVPMFMSFAVLSTPTPLVGQSSFLFGYAGTLGGGIWQLEALEVGFVTSLGLGPVRSGAATLRGGWFADQAVLLSGTRGLVGALALALRSGRLPLAEVGDATTPTVIALDVSLEGAGYLAAHSPLPEGQRWVSVAVLPALRMGQAEGMQFTLTLGPAFFAGRTQHMHTFVAVRGEFPLARRSGGP